LKGIADRQIEVARQGKSAILSVASDAGSPQRVLRELCRITRKREVAGRQVLLVDQISCRP